MPNYAIVTDGTVTNVVVADPSAAQPGWAAIDGTTPTPGIGWAYDGTTWTPPAPPAPTAQQQAQATLAGIAAQLAADIAQLAVDLASVQAGWSTVAADDQTAILGRILAGLGTAMTAVANHAVFTGALPPPEQQT